MGDTVMDACTDLADYMARLETLTPEPVCDGSWSVTAHTRRTASVEPGNAAAFRALMTAHEGVRRLLASLRLATAGTTGMRFGGSDADTAKVLALIPKAAAGLNGDGQEAVTWFINRWITSARMVHGIDEVNRWRHLPKPRPGEDLPPRCPYCGCFQLLADVEAKVVACSVPGCADEDGMPPVASMTETNGGQLEWPRGRVERGVDVGGGWPATVGAHADHADSR